MEYLSLLSVAVLIVLTAFFVISEFAIVKVRRTRIEHLANEGNKRAKAGLKVINNLDGYLSACQLGITVTALGIGWLGEPAFAQIIHPLIARFDLSDGVVHTISFVVAFAVITFLHVVLGELAPKTIAIQKAEAVTLALAPPLIFFNWIMYPFIWALNGSANFLVGLIGFSPASESDEALSEEELRMTLLNSHKSGEINDSEIEYVNKIFDFDERVAKEIMVPRKEIVCLFKEDSFEENINVMKNEKFTRYPIAEDDKDEIIGMVNIKGLFNDENPSDKNIDKHIRPVLHVIETTPIKTLLTKMQKEQSHMAIVVDEYGGTAGLVTFEDILEEIVGEIRDEFDSDETPEVQQIDDKTYLLEGKMLISDVNDLLSVDISDEELDTLGGWVLSKNNEPKQGTIISEGHYHFMVKEVEGHQVKYVETRELDQKEETSYSTASSQ
ncbi:hemolysin family protein [Virgibacillus necropolis]|uniref:Transporter associated domain protein n=1 Tax=Virgibacillus necropolis TaxID=163877 RepID=A0A221MFJ8_9BACI|nr:hemolysin family protein [Virgibacillus necropolis]ASN06446.1 hypothetical protein CFK40_16190 [Virgibacillus necropolis]